LCDEPRREFVKILVVPKSNNSAQVDLRSCFGPIRIVVRGIFQKIQYGQLPAQVDEELRIDDARMIPGRLAAERVRYGTHREQQILFRVFWMLRPKSKSAACHAKSPGPMGSVYDRVCVRRHTTARQWNDTRLIREYSTRLLVEWS
jgi:hypothetical protein